MQVKRKGIRVEKHGNTELKANVNGMTLIGYTQLTTQSLSCKWKHLESKYIKHRKGTCLAEKGF